MRVPRSLRTRCNMARCKVSNPKEEGLPSCSAMGDFRPKYTELTDQSKKIDENDSSYEPIPLDRFKVPSLARGHLFRRGSWRGIRRFEPTKGGNHMPKKRKTKKTKIKRKRTARKSKPKKWSTPKLNVFGPVVPDDCI